MVFLKISPAAASFLRDHEQTLDCPFFDQEQPTAQLQELHNQFIRLS